MALPKQIKEQNQTIAKFMGSNNPDFVSINGARIPIENSYYHVSWDWLMPVVERINDLNNVVSINENQVTVINNTRSEKLVNVVSDTMFNAIYEAVIKYIKLLYK